MTRFYLKIAVYIVSYIICLYGLSALDFNRFLKKNKAAQAQVLWIVLGMVLAYLLGSFFMSVIYYFQL